jgi:hypothetical protein
MRIEATSDNGIYCEAPVILCVRQLNKSVHCTPERGRGRALRLDCESRAMID